MGEIRRSRSRFQCTADETADVRVAAVEACLQKIQASDDHGEHVVEIMRHPTRQLSYRLHLLRLSEVLFSKLAPARLLECPRMGSFQFRVSCQSRGILPSCIL